MNEHDRVLSALTDEVNMAHAALTDLNVPVVLEGKALSLPERIAWLNLTRPAPGTSVPADRAPTSEAGATGGGRAATGRPPRVRRQASSASRSLIAADAARRPGKRVMAVPGSVLSPLSVGCHRLLRDGAGLVESADDVLAELRAAGAALELPPLPGVPSPRPALPEGGR